MSGLAPSIGGRRPAFGLRIRKDDKRVPGSADFNCRCGHAEGPVIGDFEAETLAVRAERHMRDDCPLPDIRAAAELRDWRRHHPTKKRRK